MAPNGAEDEEKWNNLFLYPTDYKRNPVNQEEEHKLYDTQLKEPGKDFATHIRLGNHLCKAGKFFGALEHYR